MKNITIAVLGTALIWGCWNLSQMDFTQVYQAETKEVIIDNTPEWATDPEAVEAAEQVLKRKALEAELTQLESEIEERQARVDEIEKELSF